MTRRPLCDLSLEPCAACLALHVKCSGDSQQWPSAMLDRSSLMGAPVEAKWIKGFCVRTLPHATSWQLDVSLHSNSLFEGFRCVTQSSWQSCWSGVVRQCSIRLMEARLEVPAGPQAVVAAVALAEVVATARAMAPSIARLQTPARFAPTAPPAHRRVAAEPARRGAVVSVPRTANALASHTAANVLTAPNVPAR